MRVGEAPRRAHRLLVALVLEEVGPGGRLEALAAVVPGIPHVRHEDLRRLLLGVVVLGLALQLAQRVCNELAVEVRVPVGAIGRRCRLGGHVVGHERVLGAVRGARVPS
eukprot:4405204-Alexandrium_andersonii.AAC.1